MTRKFRKFFEALVPKCVTLILSFLGLTNYYRPFIKDYAKIAAPLFAATKGSEKK